MIKLYNTLSRKKDELRPIHKEWVGLYTCGPTVYNYAHIGNLRTYIFEDILLKTLKYNGHEVRRVMNITDVGHLTGDSDTGDDKLDKEAREKKKSVEEIAQFYTDAFFEDLKKLNIEKPDIIAPATKFVREQIAAIETLFERRFAYQTANAVYFDVSKFKNYGKLSGQSLEEKTVGARDEVVIDKEKRNPADFALWFKLEGRFKHHLLHWPSPWGEGFPGWHIECSAISRHFLGQPFDIHTGGVDHIGTHHTNEIAQSEAAYGVPLAHIWMHGEFLLIDQSKMAKSERNFFTLSDIEKKGYNPLIFRYLVLGAHYRTKLNFTWESLDAAKNGLENLYQQLETLTYLRQSVGHQKKRDEGLFKETEDAYLDAINDDLNIPIALSVMQKMLRSALSAVEKLELARKFDNILGLSLEVPMERPIKNLQEAIEKFGQYQQFRANKQFTQSDALRKEIEGLRYSIKGTGSNEHLEYNEKFF